MACEWWKKKSLVGFDIGEQLNAKPTPPWQSVIVVMQSSRSRRTLRPASFTLGEFGSLCLPNVQCKLITLLQQLYVCKCIDDGPSRDYRLTYLQNGWIRRMFVTSRERRLAENTSFTMNYQLITVYYTMNTLRYKNRASFKKNHSTYDKRAFYCSLIKIGKFTYSKDKTVPQLYFKHLSLFSHSTTVYCSK